MYLNILGIDPGSINCGYAIINKSGKHLSLIEAGVIKIKRDSLQYQIAQMIENFDIVFNSFNIDSVAIEDIFFAYNPKTVLRLAQFRGAISLKVIQDIGYFSEYTPLQVKKALTGNGKSSKDQVAFMVKRILGIKKEIKPLDITDALAVAITHSMFVKNG